MYNHQQIEKKWQKFWAENNIFRTLQPHETGLDERPVSEKPKYYVLDMFPYPSGAGLHVGHPEGYTANDIVARYKHAKGYNVLHPMGWDAFGLPAENYAIKTGVHPKITTAENIATFKRQIQNLGFSYDWSREIDTTDPKYFQWTQWIFLKLFESGLAYEQDLPINYCPSCKTGLANEEVLGDFSCERCGTQVEKKKIRQWVLAITKYAERLLKDVDDLDWPEGIKDMQRNWIGRSEGCEFEMKKYNPPISDHNSVPLNKGERTEGEGDCSIRVYTTRVDTVFGMTYAVIAPDHPAVEDFITGENRADCEAYIDKANKQSDQDRTADDKEKTGVFTGSFVVNPYNGEQVPLWIADYVLGSYGTGAVMAVPAHDERDFEFAKKYGLGIKQSVAIELVGKGVIAPKEGKKLREKSFTNAIIEFDGKILVLQEKEGCKFVGGGIEKGETEKQAVLREIDEETGFTDILEIQQIPNTAFYGYAYRPAKDRNDKGLDTPFFYVKLNSLASKGISDEEADIHELKWLDFDEVENSLMSNGHKHAWNYFKNQRPFTNYGKLVNSGEYNGLTSQVAKEKLTALAEEKGFGHKKVNYKLRDWLFSRQRYWGEPIPLIHLSPRDIENLPQTQSEHAWVKDGEILMIGEKEFSKIYDGIYGKIVCDYRLPLELPEVEAYEPAGDGQSPLAKVDNFIHVQLADNLSGRRETNTMPQWGGSCWYYLRFMDAGNPDALVGSEAEKYWGQVDSYVGGAEHAVLHLLYARFWHKFLFDIGVVSTNEPFYRLRNQGMILGMSYRNSKGKLIASDMVDEVPVPGGTGTQYIDKETGDVLEKIPAKMSKSLKNVINPDDIVKEYGADTLRLYEMYMGDFADSKPWDTSAIVGVRRFLDRMNTVFIEGKEKTAESDEIAMKTLHKTIKKVGEDIENYKFNTAIAQMMILLNTGHPKDHNLAQEWKEKFVKLLHPFAPHLAEEMWEKTSSQPSPLGEKEQAANDIHVALLSSKGEEIQRGGKYSKIYFATENKSKIERAQKLFSRIDSDVQIEKYPEIIEVEETGKTSLECALQKLEVYKGKDIDAPIAVADTSVHFHDAGFDFEPPKVKRTALELAGKTESELSVEEVAELMISYYQEKARENVGSIDYHYIDSWAVLYPNGEVKTFEYRREYTLTDEIKGELIPYFPMNSLYVSKYTGKRHHESTDEDFFVEFAGQAEAMRELFGYQPKSIFFESWPEYDEAMTIDSEVTIGVQVLGKLRGEIKISKDEDKDSVLAKAKENADVKRWIDGKEIVKEIYVPGKIVNIVVK